MAEVAVIGCPRCGKNLHDNRYKCHRRRKLTKKKLKKLVELIKNS